MIIAYRDGDAEVVRHRWPIGGVALGIGAVCTVDGFSGRLHQYDFGQADELAIRTALDGVARFNWYGVELVREEEPPAWSE